MDISKCLSRFCDELIGETSPVVNLVLGYQSPQERLNFKYF